MKAAHTVDLVNREEIFPRASDFFPKSLSGEHPKSCNLTNVYFNEGYCDTGPSKFFISNKKSWKTASAVTLSQSVNGVMVSIAAFQAVDPGSIPGWCKYFF